jgi:hypothetical protein
MDSYFSKDLGYVYDELESEREQSLNKGDIK